MSAWPFGALPPLSFDLIAADPPWDFGLRSARGAEKSASAHYATMPLADIKALPVDRLAQRDCVLLLWSTGSMLPQALDVMSAWGFAFKSSIAWRKTTPAGKVRVGTGYWVRTMHEPVLLGTIGSPSKIRALPSIFDGVAREHSRKPESSTASLSATVPERGCSTCSRGSRGPDGRLGGTRPASSTSLGPT